MFPHILELSVVVGVALEGNGLMLSGCRTLGLLFPWKALGAELDRGAELS